MGECCGPRDRERSFAGASRAGVGWAGDGPPVAAAGRAATRPAAGGGGMGSVSFEVFPPRSPQAEGQLWSALERLAPLEPSFVSVTCGAGGSGADATLGAVRALSAR